LDNADDLLDEQIEYYRARAPWYDDWWNRRGQYERHDDVAIRWRADLDAMLADLDDWLAIVQPQRVLELASGTGEFTRRLVARSAHVTAVDAAPEMHALSAAKLGDANSHVTRVTTDLFSWHPPVPYDAVLHGFWISHVPKGRWDDFWAMIRAALVPGGHVWFTDNAPPELAWQKQVLSPPADPKILEGDGRIDRSTDVHERVLPDGRTFKLVKHFHDPDELARDLESRGFDVDMRTTDWAFMIGRLTRR
jgi:SAM-dependent methyltransferase